MKKIEETQRTGTLRGEFVFSVKITIFDNLSLTLLRSDAINSHVWWPYNLIFTPLGIEVGDYIEISTSDRSPFTSNTCNSLIFKDFMAVFSSLGCTIVKPEG